MLILIFVVFIVLGVLGLVVGYSAVISIKGEIRDYRQRKESREAQRRASTHGN